MKYLKFTDDIELLGSRKNGEYTGAKPFPNIVFDDFFDENLLADVLDEFPDLSKRDNWFFYKEMD